MGSGRVQGKNLAYKKSKSAKKNKEKRHKTEENKRGLGADQPIANEWIYPEKNHQRHKRKGNDR